jgi:glutamyl/glutaminyl-tRNA synthetase
MKILSEFSTLAGFFFERPNVFERPLETNILNIGLEALRQSEWNHDAMEKAIRDAADEKGVKAKDVFMELRLAVTGKTVGPPLLESYIILGKDEVVERIKMVSAGLE